MISNILINGKKIDRKFNKADDVIDFAETELTSKENNVIICNDNNKFLTFIQILNSDCSETEYEVIFYNPDLEADRLEKLENNF